MRRTDGKPKAPKTPPGCYWQDGVLWGKVRVPGQARYSRWSLRTSDAMVALQRWMKEGHQHRQHAADLAYHRETALADNSGLSEPFSPRGMALEIAAQYVGLNPAKFLMLVDDGHLPASFKIAGVELWDRYELDPAFDQIKKRNKRPPSRDFPKRLGNDGYT